MKYLKLRQNNSGGYFVIDDVQANYVIIECESVKDEHVTDIVDSLDDNSCACCGQRWCYYADDGDLEDTIEKWNIQKSLYEPLEEVAEKQDDNYDPSTENHEIVLYKNKGKDREYWKYK